MPVELVLWIVLEGEPAQEVSRPDAHQHHGHESGHLSQSKKSVSTIIASTRQG